MEHENELTIAQTAVVLDYSTASVYQLVKDGRLKRRLERISGRDHARFDAQEVKALKIELDAERGKGNE